MTLIEDLQPMFRRWARSLSLEHADDILQDGNVEALVAAKRHQGLGDLRSYVCRCVYLAMKKSLLHRTVGRVRRDERRGGDGTYTGAQIPVDALVLHNFLPEILYDRLEDAYHHGEIHQAINELPVKAKEYVFRRFWLDQPVKEISKEIGWKQPNNLWQPTKEQLAEKLAHLKE